MTVFVAAWLAGVLAYMAAAFALEQRGRALALRRISSRGAGRRAERADGPRLIAEDHPERGRMAAGLLRRLRLMPAVERLLETADIGWTAAGFLHRLAGLFLAGFLAATVPLGNRAPLLAALSGAAASGALFWRVRRRASARLRGFEEQFPDCLEFISRSMRAGHAFSVALEMVRREFSDPLAAEFRRVFEEQNLGQPLDIVLRKLSRRIPSMDVQFFVSAVLLQKRTGGNLAELLDKLAQLIRERFKLRARVRAVSAQGLMSGRILSAIPLAVGVLMFMANPQYARFFIDDPAGQELLAAALGLQFCGYLIIRKIVKIEV